MSILKDYSEIIESHCTKLGIITSNFRSVLVTLGHLYDGRLSNYYSSMQNFDLDFFSTLVAPLLIHFFSQHIHELPFTAMFLDSLAFC